jgi:hypothetical protein
MLICQGGKSKLRRVLSILYFLFLWSVSAANSSVFFR